MFILCIQKYGVIATKNWPEAPTQTASHFTLQYSNHHTSSRDKSRVVTSIPEFCPSSSIFAQFLTDQPEARFSPRDLLDDHISKEATF